MNKVAVSSWFFVSFWSFFGVWSVCWGVFWLFGFFVLGLFLGWGEDTPEDIGFFFSVFLALTWFELFLTGNWKYLDINHVDMAAND